jgi:hypothetical protein
LLSKPEKYCHNGGMAFAHHHGAGLAWDRKVDDGPFAWSPRNRRFAGERLTGSGVRALWGPQWTRLPTATSAAA